jgi:membrane protease YdiL (CAAX protease family)
MSPRRVLVVALATQAGLIALAWWAAALLDLPPHWGRPWRDALLGCVVALALGVGNHLLLTRAPSNWVTDGVRRVYSETIVPLFRGLSPWGAVAIGAAAGVGEEWVFRGILQPLTGLMVASVIFGLAHVGGVRMLAFGVWAAMMGVVMGVLAMVTGGLTAPMVAHGLYDILALEYIRRGAHTE